VVFFICGQITRKEGLENMKEIPVAIYCGGTFRPLEWVNGRVEYGLCGSSHCHLQSREDGRRSSEEGTHAVSLRPG